MHRPLTALRHKAQPSAPPHELSVSLLVYAQSCRQQTCVPHPAVTFGFTRYQIRPRQRYKSVNNFRLPKVVTKHCSTESQICNNSIASWYFHWLIISSLSTDQLSWYCKVAAVFTIHPKPLKTLRRVRLRNNLKMTNQPARITPSVNFLVITFHTYITRTNQ